MKVNGVSFKVNGVSLNIQSYVGEEGKHVSRGWAAFERVLQKGVPTVLPHTRKLDVFLGSNTSHPTPKYLTKRWAQTWARTWAQRFPESLTLGGWDESQ